MLDREKDDMPSKPDTPKPDTPKPQASSASSKPAAAGAYGVHACCPQWCAHTLWLLVRIHRSTSAAAGLGSR